MNPLTWAVVFYLAVMTAAAFVMCGIDKYKAKRNKWRIPEKTLLIMAAAGGSLGLLAGMYIFRHKTLHKKFTLGVPAIICIQAALAVLLIKL